MKSTVIKIFIMLTALLLSACNNQLAYQPEADELIFAEEAELSYVEDIAEQSISTFQVSYEIQLSIVFVTDEFLCSYESFSKFDEEHSDEFSQRIAFMVNVPVSNFRFIEIDGAEIEFIVRDELHVLDELLPEKPFVATWHARGSMPHRGISFADENNVTRYFAFHYDARGYPYDYFRLQEFERTIFTTTIRIHEDMPLFTFYRRLREYVSEPFMAEAERYASITIFDEAGRFIQEIDGIVQGGHASWMTADWDIFEIQFDDFNFDGYLDMWLVYAVNPGSAGGAWAYYWLWSPEDGQFVLNEQLSLMRDMAWLDVDSDAQQLITRHRISGTHFVSSYYEYVGGEFALVASADEEYIWTREFVPTYWQTTRRNLVTGEVTIETDPPNSLPDYIIYKTVDIHSGMPFPTHEVRLKMWRLPEDSEYRVGGYQYEIAIYITGRRQTTPYGWMPTAQTIRGLRAGYGHGRWIDIDPKNPLNLHFADFNGDGFLDMAIRRSAPQTGGMADDSHYFWLWNPEWNRFERNYSLEHAVSFGQLVSANDGYVVIFSFHSIMYQGWATYAYVDGEFVPVGHESVVPSY